MNASPPSSAARRLPPLVLTVAVPAVHAYGLTLGLFIDDYNHAEQARGIGYAPADLARGFEFDFNGRILPFWWGDRPVYLHYFRPAQVLAHKLLFDAFGLWAPAHHAHSLAWHLGCCLLVYRLGVEWLGCRSSALLGGLVFGLHPVQMPAVHWTATVAEPMYAFWSLLALLLTIRTVRAGSPGWAAWLPAYAACAVALVSRETAVMLPVALTAAGRWWIPRWSGAAAPPCTRFAPFFALAAGYLAWRTWTLGGFPVPPPPYFHSPAEPGFAAHVAAKALWNSAGILLCAMPAPVLSESLLAEHPWLWVAMAGAVASVGGPAAWRLRGRGGAPAFWVLWAVLFCLPTLPMFVSPHYLYLPTAGWAMLAAALRHTVIAARPPAWYPRPIGYVFGPVLAAYLGLAVVAFLILRAGFSLGQLALEDVAARPTPYPPGAKLFFVNLSPLAHEILPAARVGLDRPDLTGTVLTFSPDLLGPHADCRLRRLDVHTLEVSSPARPFFAGRIGRTVLLIGGRTAPLRTGESFRAADFTATVVRADDSGAAVLRFRFDRPLDSPEYVFLLGTRRRAAAPLDMRAVEGPAATDRP